MTQASLFDKAFIAARLVTMLRLGVTVISLLSQVVLARLLVPEAFGKMAFLLFVLELAGRVMSLQSENGIIREQQNANHALHAYFTIEGLLTATAALLLVFLGPGFMSVLDKPDLGLPIQIAGFLLILRWLRTPLILAKKELDFRQVTHITLAGEIAKPLVSIGLAWLGFGFWSLFWGMVAYESVQTAMIWLKTPYRPQWVFEKDRLRDMIRFAWPLTLSGFLSYWYWRIDDFWVGKLLGDEQLGYYWMAFTIPHAILAYVENLDRVTYPAFAKAENDDQLLKGFAIITRFSALILLFPCLVSLLWATPIITLMFGAKWLPAVVPFQIFMGLIVFRGTFRHWANIAILKGHTHIFLKVVAASAILVTVLAYGLTPQYGITGTAWAVVVAMLAVSPIYFIWFKLHYNIRYWHMLWQPAMIAIVTFLFGLSLSTLFNNIQITGLFVQILCTSLFYLFCIWVFDRSSFNLVRNRLKWVS